MRPPAIWMAMLTIPDPSRCNLPICVTLTVSGSELRVDLTGTAPQVSDRPIICRWLARLM